MRHRIIRHPLPLHLYFYLGLSASITCAADIAHSNTDPVILPELVITETYRNTATKSALAPEETPQSISVIDNEMLQMRDVDSVNEALRYVPGVTTELRGGAVSRLDQFTIRGFSNYQNTYDGMPLLFNGWNLQPQVDALAVEQVEIFKGPTSSLYGSMPPGGFVNLISKQPSRHTYHQLNLAIGSSTLTEMSTESRGMILSSDLSYSLVTLVRKRDGQALTSEEERQVFAPSIDWPLSNNTLINFNLYFQNDPSAGIYNSVPAAGSVLTTPYGQLEPDFYAGDANWNTYERRVALPGYKVNHNFNNGWILLHQARYMDANVYQENTYSAGFLGGYYPLLPNADQILVRRAYLTDETSTAWTVDNQLAGQVFTGQIEHHLLFGVDTQQLESQIRYEDGVTVPINLYMPNNNLVNPEALPAAFAASGYSSDFTLKSKQTGLYFQDQLRINNWVMIFGGRYDRYNYKESGRKYGVSASNAIDQEEFSGRAGVLYEVNNRWAPYLSYAQSFEPIGGSDRNGKTFDPAWADQWEIGTKFVSNDQHKQLTVAAFEITKRNALTRDPSGGPTDQIQAGETQSRGIELETMLVISDELMGTFNYTWIDVEVTKDNYGLQGKTPIWIARNTANIWLQYDPFDSLLAEASLGVGVRYIGKTQMNALNTDTVPAYTLFDLAVSREMGSANVRLTATNITNKRYYTCYDNNNCWFGSQRSIELGLNYPF